MSEHTTATAQAADRPAPARRIRVGEGTAGDAASANSYDVVVGSRLLDELPALLEGARRVLVVHPSTLRATGEAVREHLAGVMQVQAICAEVPDAEQAKTAAVLQSCWQVLGQAAFTRTDAIVAVGGGAVTDLAGFVAATWLRGVRVVHLPTTLLAMVDAAVGGKSGINTAEGKNLVGAFHAPAGVLCDLAALRTLPPGDVVAGLAEVVKTGFVADPVILDLVGEHGEAARDPASPVLRELVERSIVVKADVVTRDLKESWLREILNYGHTFGHAVEQVERYSWRHGAAVSVGMMYAAELGRLADRTPDALVERHREVLGALGLPVTYAGGRWDALYTAMRRDKKNRGEMLRFVVLEDVGRPVRLEGPEPALLVRAYGEVTATG